MVHPWHDVPYGEKAPDEVNVIIEVPRDGVLKYELDKETGLIKLDRVLYSAVHYPGDYGFIPRTCAPDKDPVDVLIISNYPIFPGVIVKVRPIGVLELYDGKDRDDKIIAMHAGDPRVNHIKSIKDLSINRINEVKHFFEVYKQLQGKKVKILSLKGPQEAKKVIRKGIEQYKQQKCF